MPNPIVYSHADSADLAKSLGEHVVKIQNAALATKPRFNVAVSGGSLVKTLKNGLVNRGDVQWDKW
jgi:6-phosphogluconolactonase